MLVLIPRHGPISKSLAHIFYPCISCNNISLLLHCKCIQYLTFLSMMICLVQWHEYRNAGTFTAIFSLISFNIRKSTICSACEFCFEVRHFAHAQWDFLSPLIRYASIRINKPFNNMLFRIIFTHELMIYDNNGKYLPLCIF